MTQAYHSPEALQRIYAYNHLVALYLWIGLLAVLLCAGSLNVYHQYHGYKRRKLAGKYALTRETALKGCSRTGKTCTRWVPAMFLALARKYTIKESKVARVFGMKNLGQLGLITLYIAFNLGLCLGGADNDISWQAHHAARLTFANLPLVIGLASKNNLISFLTGFSYESLNVFHRWTARMIFVLSVIHIAGRIHVNVPSTTTTGVGQAYIRWGIVAFLAMFWLVAVSLRPIRNAFYSTFIITHVLAVFILLASLWVHRPQVRGWIIAGIAVYLFDRIWRTSRILIFSLYYKIPFSKTEPLAWVEALSKDTVRVTVRSRMDWVPGAHVYLHCPNISKSGYLGHPFTVSTIAQPLVQSEDEKRHDESRQELLIRVRSGVTRRLYELATKNTNLEASDKWPRANLYAWSEGPYGRAQYLGQEFQTVVLITGGSGVTFALPIMQDIIRRARSMAEGRIDQAVSIERLTFVWIIRDEGQISWIAEHLREAQRLAPAGLLHIKIYCTRKSTIKDETDPEFPVTSGRPEFSKLIAEEIRNTHFTDWLAVGTCGPSPMCADLAEAVGDAIQPKLVLRGEHRRNIYYSYVFRIDARTLKFRSDTKNLGGKNSGQPRSKQRNEVSTRFQHRASVALNKGQTNTREG